MATFLLIMDEVGLNFIAIDEHTYLSACFNPGESEKRQPVLAQTGTIYATLFFHSQWFIIQTRLSSLIRHSHSHMMSLPVSESENSSTNDRNYPPVALPAVDEVPARAGLPAGSRVPLPACDYFSGRQADLLELAKGLLISSDADRQSNGLVVCGVDGMGKTQLALEFCYRYGRFFNGVHWLRGDQNLMAEMAACAFEMGAEDRNRTLSEQVQWMLDEWMGEGERLVVLDNVSSEAALKEWVSSTRGVRFLLTTSEAGLHRELGFSDHALYVLSPAESRLFLRSQVPRLANISDLDLDSLAEQLWRMPFSLYLASCCLVNCERLELDGYRSRLDDALVSPRTSVQREWVTSRFSEKAISLVAAYDLNWQLLEAGSVDRLAKQVFRVCGHIAPEVPVPLLILQEALAVKGSAGMNALQKALERLYRLGLLMKTENGPVIHSLTAYFARIEDQLAEVSVFPALAEAMALIINEPDEDEAKRLTPQMMREHLFAAALAAEEARLDQAGFLLDQMGKYLESLTDYQRARDCYERALRCDELLYGEMHPLVARRLNNLAGVLRVHGDLDSARACYERALDINEQLLGSEHLIIAENASNLGSVLRTQGELEGAEACYRRALQIMEASLGKEHAAVGMAANNLGNVLRSRGDLAGAQECYEKVLRIDENIYPPEHPEMARDVNNLGSVLRARGDLYGAKACYELSLRIWEKAYNPQHPVVALAENNLGSVLEELGELTGARLCYEQALAIDETAYGNEHPNVAVRANNLGRVMHLESNLEGAKAAFMRALRIDEKVFDENHPNIARDLNNLGMVLKDLGDLAGAEAYYERALAILKHVLGEEHANVAMTVNNLGSVLEDQGDLSGARACYQQALAILEKTHGKEHSTVASVINNLGSVFEDLGKLEDAKKCYMRALKIWEKNFGADHPDVATAVNNLGSVLRAQGDMASAKKCWERALRIDQSVFGSDHPVVGIRYNNLAGVLEKEGDMVKARDYYERAANIFAKFFPDDHPNLQVVLRNLESMDKRSRPGNAAAGE